MGLDSDLTTSLGNCLGVKVRVEPYSWHFWVVPWFDSVIRRKRLVCFPIPIQLWFTIMGEMALSHLNYDTKYQRIDKTSGFCPRVLSLSCLPISSHCVLFSRSHFERRYEKPTLYLLQILESKHTCTPTPPGSNHKPLMIYPILEQ